MENLLFIKSVLLSKGLASTEVLKALNLVESEIKELRAMNKILLNTEEKVFEALRQE